MTELLARALLRRRAYSAPTDRILSPAFRLEDLPLGVRQRLRQLSQENAVANDDLPLPQELCLPAVRLPVKAELAGPSDVIHADCPDRLAGLRRSWRAGSRLGR